MLEPETDDTEVLPPNEQRDKFNEFDESIVRVRNGIAEKKEAAIKKEIRLRKIIYMLKQCLYTSEQINVIFTQHASKELFDDIVTQYDALKIQDPDISDIV